MAILSNIGSLKNNKGNKMKYTKEWFEKWKNEEYCWKMIRENEYVIQYIKNPSEKMCLEAVRRNLNLIQFIDKYPIVWNYYLFNE